ncbi:hypothetical protein GALMADRAFT_1100723 [Galerina marginata CBS 339.88]|uniref:F-box domain-containing protein n=1 Tax=Galerina marginata (strain CBS 339.88) TaxID=685588 RepID=A0A067TBU9_GALM3|nr:hypothetical protein GALMADRAFT_1100723 [Galerina marginata CBS 339.88]
MHSALLIDEVLRQIFHFCSENNLHSLVCAARSCKAWKDPALDFVWVRLSSLTPLLLLLPGFSITNNEFVYSNDTSPDNSHSFNSYARRVKHVSNRQKIEIHSSAVTASPFSYSSDVCLPNLETAHISIPRCNALVLPLSLSPNLLRLDIDLGFKSRTPDVDSPLCEYLELVSSHSPRLRHITLRGIASKRLNSIISSMRNLQSLSLRLGHSLSIETLRAIIIFPSLLELEVHAGHIEINDLDELHQYPTHTMFASLRKLHIRAKSNLVEVILQLLQPNTLYHLHIELDDAFPSDSYWNTIFACICSKSTSSLHHLTLEHHFELPEPMTSMPSDVTHVALHMQSPKSSSMLFETTQMLGTLKLLRHFACDVTLPAIMSDQDVAKLVTWWPDLEYLELGSAPQAEDQPNEVSRMTIASLALFAAKCPELRKLILPLSIGDVPVLPIAQVSTPNNLHHLTIAQLKTPNPLGLAQYLHYLFPFLEDVEGPCDDTQPWTDTKDALQRIIHG